MPLEFPIDNDVDVNDDIDDMSYWGDDILLAADVDVNILMLIEMLMLMLVLMLMLMLMLMLTFIKEPTEEGR